MKLILVPQGGDWFGFLLNDKNHIVEVRTGPLEGTDMGSIYIGRVEQVKANINSAFVRIDKDRKVFLSFQDAHHFFYTKRQNTKAPRPVQGDELLVQIEKEAHKTKLAKVTSDFVLTGRYVVLTTDKKRLFVSSKIQHQSYRKALKARLKPYVTEDFGYIIRTHAQTVTMDEVIEEMGHLAGVYASLTEFLRYKPCYSKIYEPPAGYLTMIRDLNMAGPLEVITTDEVMAGGVERLGREQGIDVTVACNREASGEELLKAYGLREKLQKLFQKKVWLKSGASIVIEPTEAMTVIDVNTEKTMSKKRQEGTLLSTNLEAATAIMKQIRARNISGIIVVDFIDMKRGEDKDALLEHLEKLALAEPIKTTVHGMTTLGLVEMTRKKIEKPIWENEGLKGL